MDTAANPMTEISDAAFNLIIEFEVTSPAFYQAHYRHPEWPGLNSGVTIGVGYDLGYSSQQIFVADWGDVLPEATIKALAPACGFRGEDANQICAALQSVDVPWEAAINVFKNRDVPRWSQTVTNSLPNTETLHPDSFGALVSLTYNRGASFETGGDRYREMRAIKDHMTGQSFSLIPDDIRAMKRLWPSVRSLRNRRDREANLFQAGLQ